MIRSRPVSERLKLKLPSGPANGEAGIDHGRRFQAHGRRARDARRGREGDEAGGAAKQGKPRPGHR